MDKSNTKQCLKCLEYKAIKSNFYTSTYEWYSDGKVPFCKKCITKQVDIENERSVINILKVMNLPFYSTLWRKTIHNSSKEPFGMYLKSISLNHKHKTFDDSEFGDFENEDHVASSSSVSTSDLQQLSDFWGRGFSEKDYLWMQNEFEDFITRYECDSKGMELLIKQICLTELNIQNQREKGEKVDAQLKTLQDLLGSSNLKPVQESGANSVEQETFGTLIKKYENEKPIPEPDPKWTDVDKISKYVRVFFLGHLSRMIGVKNKYAEEYWDEMNKLTVEEPSDESEDEENVIV